MNTKNSLAIRLTEPIIFLHPTSSRHEDDTAATLGSSLLRGLLRLTITKPMRVSGIEIELLGKSCTVRDEGLGASRAEIKEEHEVYHSSTVFFDAKKTVNQAGNGWKDFAKGVYNYPISFEIPANAPPSLECKFGFVQWLLKARVHRPGPFAPKMTCARDITLIPYPSERSQQPVRTVNHTSSELLYLDVELSSRNAYIGTRIPMQFTLRPLSDMVKVSEVAVWLEERVDYYTRMHRIARTEPLRRTQLMCLRNPSKGQYTEPILPLSTSCTPENSHWLSLLCPNVVQPATLSSGGPWQFSHELQLPETCSDVHFSSTNPAGNITITHNLKIIVVVLLSAGEDFRKGTAHWKRVEVVNNIPVQLISCCCKPEWAALPAYSASSSHSNGIPHTCPCTPKGNKSPDASSARLPHPHHHNHLLLRQPTGATSSVLRFERIVSGQENTAGEIPPSYESVYTSPPSLRT